MSTPIDRRSFMKWTVAGAAAAAAGPAAILGAARRDATSGSYMLQMNGYAPNAETPLALLTDYLTPNELFFVRNHWIPHLPDRAKWRLTIDGEVSRPGHLTLADLRAMPATTVTCVLQCAGNGRSLHKPVVPGVQWSSGAVGNAAWRGVRVRDLLESRGVQPSAKHLHLFGSDDPPRRFHRSIEASSSRKR